MMRVALVAHIRHPIAPPFAGGMEAHSYHLARGLAARGHDVTLFASGDSAVPEGVRLHPVVATHYDRDFPWHRFHGTDALTAHLDAAYARAGRDILGGGYDIVHNNSLHRFMPRLAVAHGVPMVTSLHVPPFDALRRAVHGGIAPWTRFTVTSRTQLDRWWPGAPPPEASVLPNGIDLAEWPFKASGHGGAVWAGRITPTKGPHLAVRAARRAGLPLTLFGTIEHRDYFETDVRPYLGGDIRYGGHLRGADLAREIGAASVLLFTPLWDEPFGLAAIEAMATGVPVACTDRGAVREVVGECGRFAPSDDVAALAHAAREAIGLPRADCRARVEALFSQDVMLDRAEALYADARAAAPVAAPSRAFRPFELQVAPPVALSA
ncbi:glycosyltransferase [Jannaschia sp. KMU-145]|uniref:glycosyltransferase n=1 Tax=Jannaschia halovivens TaxID=3388667 RepID=UPI00396AF842